jgi:outer membrane protein assembly factor BamB
MAEDDKDAPKPEHPSPTRGAKGRWRIWLPLVLIAVEAAVLGGLSYAKHAEWMSPANVFLSQFSVVGLGTILLFLWFVFLSPAPRTLRKRTGLVGVALVALTALLVRPEGVTGDIHFRFNWRFAPRADEALPAAASQVAKSSEVNLLETTPHDYPQFLGPDRRATLSGVHLARDWNASPPKLLWRQPIGAGWSSFAIVGHYGVTQEQRGSDELITCYDIDTGKLQWAHATPVRFQELIAGIGPRATPTIHEGRVYALGALGHLHCLDGATGKVLWRHDVVTETGATPPQWGKSCSPLVYENLVIVSAGAPGGKSLVAYDKLDGKQVWSAGDDASAYASPALLTLCGQPQIVMVNETMTCGHDPADGRVLWRHPWPDAAGPASPNVAQPMDAGDDRILLSKGYGVGCTLWQIKREGDTWSVEPLWKRNTLKTKMTNPVLRDGYAYGLDEGTLSCIDLRNGNKKWKQTRYGHGQVLLVDDLLLVQSESGEIALVEATPKGFSELARATVVSGQSWNYPALSGRKLLVRSELEAACYELPEGSP